tara:strand:+ start:354 stop:668 length:315 start_codon:yes stop_codon:yes gene_type:complete
MKIKKENCKYCGEKLEAKTTRREFCSNKCKVYWHRESAATIEYVPNFSPTSKANIEKFEAVFKKEFDKVATPKTLDQLKAICPKELTGFEKSTWISVNRLKYGI